MLFRALSGLREFHKNTQASRRKITGKSAGGDKIKASMPRLIVAPRTVVAYHGCTLPVARAILSDGAFRASENRYDWLGKGVYFWEYAPYRALEWAKWVSLQKGDAPAVLSATIRLGNCVNLMDVQYHNDLIATHDNLVALYGEENLPKNTNSGGHFRDRLVIDGHCDYVAGLGEAVDTVRGTFPEGEPIYPGSKILSLAHTQIAVRRADCISRIALVKFP